MKKIYLYLMLALPFLVGNCASDPNVGQSEPQEPVSLTINEAKEFFESIIRANANSGTQPCKNILNPGEFTPQWNNAVCSTEGRYYCVQLPINSQYRFRAIRSEFKECSAQAYRVDAEQRLVLLKSKVTKALSMLIVTLIPDRDYAESNKGRLTGRSFSGNDDDKFQGLVLGHSVIRGRLFSVETYTNGLRKKRVYFYIPDGEYAEKTLIANEMLKNVNVIKKANIHTRNGYESPWDVCVCGGQGCAACNGFGQDWWPKPDDDDPGKETEDGSGNNEGSNPGSGDVKDATPEESNSGSSSPNITHCPYCNDRLQRLYCVNCCMQF